MSRWFAALLFLGCLAGCSKPVALPDTPVRSSSTEELAAFRAELGDRFPAEQLQAFDTALVELKLDAMNRGVANAADRDQQVQALILGKTVRAAEIFGWQARRTRILSETAYLSGLREDDLKAQQRTAATGTPASVLTHLQNEQDILARLHRDLNATDEQLTAWGVPPAPTAKP